MRQFELFLNHIESLDERRRILKRYDQYDLLLKLEIDYYDTHGTVNSFLPAAYKAKRDLKNAAKFFGLLGDFNSKAECLLILLRQHLLLHWIQSTTVKEFTLSTEYLSERDTPLDKSHLPIFSDLEALDKKKLPISTSLEIEIWREFFQCNSLEGYLKLYKSKRFSNNLYLTMLLSVFIACRTNVENIKLEIWSKTALDFISSFQTNYLVLTTQLNDYSKPGAHTKHVESFFAIEQAKSSEILFSRTDGPVIKDVWADVRKSEIADVACDQLKLKSEEAFLSSLRIWYQLLVNFVVITKPESLLERVAESLPANDYLEYTRTELKTKVTLVRLLKHWDEHGNNPPKVFLNSVNQLISALKPSLNSNPAIVAEMRNSFLGKEVVEVIFKSLLY
jgi:hypothetical protein